MLCLYVFSVRILYEPIKNENDVAIAEEMLNKYHNLLEEFFGRNAYTYTIHAHLHLPQQVRHHGPFHGHSQFVFEVIFIT